MDPPCKQCFQWWGIAKRMKKEKEKNQPHCLAFVARVVSSSGLAYGSIPQAVLAAVGYS
jgi:hypothetical protein